MKFQQLWDLTELKTAIFWRDVFSEFVASCFMLIYVTLAMVTLDNELYSVEMVHMGIMVGFLIFLLIEGYGNVSGLMNPSTALAFCLAGRIKPIRAIIYMLSESAGAVTGTFIVYNLTPFHLRGDIRAFQPAPSITPWQGMLLEMMLTFNLLYVGLSCSDARTHVVTLPSLPTGFTIGVGIMTAGTWTGACQNPIVALGPAVVTSNYSNHWIYWVGSYSAAFIAAAYNTVCYKAQEQPARCPQTCDNPPENKKVST